jgi:hypothetical protein
MRLGPCDENARPVPRSCALFVVSLSGNSWASQQDPARIGVAGPVRSARASVASAYELFCPEATVDAASHGPAAFPLESNSGD